MEEETAGREVWRRGEGFTVFLKKTYKYFFSGAAWPAATKKGWGIEF